MLDSGFPASQEPVSVTLNGRPTNPVKPRHASCCAQGVSFSENTKRRGFAFGSQAASKACIKGKFSITLVLICEPTQPSVNSPGMNMLWPATSARVTAKSGSSSVAVGALSRARLPLENRYYIWAHVVTVTSRSISNVIQATKFKNNRQITR